MRTIAPGLHSLNDTARELAIRRCHRTLIVAADMPSKAAAWRMMCKLIKSRSPEAVARLEEERGLARGVTQ